MILEYFHVLRPEENGKKSVNCEPAILQHDIGKTPNGILCNERFL